MSPPESLAPEVVSEPEDDVRAGFFVEPLRSRLNGFTLEALQDCEAIDPYSTIDGKNTLTNEILPILK